MTIKISRRDVLQIGCGTAAMGLTVGIGPLGSTGAAAQTRRVSAASTEETTAAGGADAPLFFRDDWLGEPWHKPEAALLIHGVYESSIAWFGWVPRMAQEFRLIRPDLPGCGASRIPPGFEWSMGSLTAVLAQLLDKLEIESAHIN